MSQKHRCEHHHFDPACDVMSTALSLIHSASSVNIPLTLTALMYIYICAKWTLVKCSATYTEKELHMLSESKKKSN